MIFAICNSLEGIVFILSSQEIIFLDDVQNYLRPLADLLMVFNSSINIGIYCIFKKEFREKFFEIYIQCNCKNKKQPKRLPADGKTAAIPMIRAQLPKTSVELTYATKEQRQETIKKATILLGADSSEEITPVDVGTEDLVETSNNHVGDRNTITSKENAPAVQNYVGESLEISRSDTGYDSESKENTSVAKDGTSPTNVNDPESNQNLEHDCDKAFLVNQDEEPIAAIEVITQGISADSTETEKEHVRTVENNKAIQESKTPVPTIAKDIALSTNENDPESNQNLEKDYAKAFVVNQEPTASIEEISQGRSEDSTETEKDHMRTIENKEAILG